MTISHISMFRRSKLPPIYETDGWYQAWYFHLRFEAELARSSRYDLPMSLLVIYRADPGEPSRERARLEGIASKGLRRHDIPAVLADNEYAVLLPHTTPKQAQAVAARMARLFGANAVT